MKRLPMCWLGLLALAVAVTLVLPLVAAEAKGKIKTIENEKNEFVMTDTNNKDWTMRLAKDGKVFINDKEAKLSDLKAGDEAEVTYDKDGDALAASVVRCTRK